MALTDDLKSDVASIFSTAWSQRAGQKVPTAEKVQYGNDAVALKATVLYADLSESTSMVQSKPDYFAAEVYKSYLHCCAKIIRHHGGVITAYDGDRIMAVFIGDRKNTDAVQTALRINYARLYIMQPALEKQYPDTTFKIKHTCGIDTSDLFVAKTGIRGSNDLVWVGRAANWAAKLTDLPNSHPTRITKSVFDVMLKEAKYASDGRLMWEKRSWTPMNNSTIYRSNFWRKI